MKTKNLLIVLGLGLMTMTSSAVSANPQAWTQLSPSEVEREYEALKRARDQNMQRLEAYRNAGSFPDNSEMKVPKAVFIDRDGVLCAFANLMKVDGQGALVRHVAKVNNHLVVGDVKRGPILTWIARSGFTHAEAAAIQVPGFMYQRPQIEPHRPNIDPEIVKRQRIQIQLDQVIATLKRNAKNSLVEATAKILSEKSGKRGSVKPWQVTYLMKKARTGEKNGGGSTDWAKHVVAHHMNGLN